jgi:tetratricopeptide (TPR) repeat protein
MWAAAILTLLFLFATDFTTEGMKALEERKYQEAADLFTKAVAADPGDYAANFHLALSYSLLGKAAEAIPVYKKVLELKPGLYEAELNLGILLAGQKPAAEAVPYLQSAADKKPKEYRPRFYLAKALLESEDFAKAEESYKMAAGMDPKSAAAQLGWAHAQARQSRLPEAAEHFRQAAALDPSYRDTLLELASLFEAGKQPGEAIAIYQQFPENTAAQERLGELLIETKRYPDAIDRLVKVVQKDPTPANNLALAQAYLLNKEPEKAIPLLDKAVAIDPGNYDLHMIYGRTLRDQKKLGAAANQFNAAAQKRPDSVEAWNELAAILTVLDDFPRALAALDRVKALGGETPGDQFFRAIILDKTAARATSDKTKHLKLALEAYENFLASSQGKYPDQEFQARQRARIIQRELTKR